MPATTPRRPARGHRRRVGRLYDCDFNQALGLPLPGPERTIWDLDDLRVLEGRAIASADHCFACTAGAGSSCGGALA